MKITPWALRFSDDPAQLASLRLKAWKIRSAPWLRSSFQTVMQRLLSFSLDMLKRLRYILAERTCLRRINRWLTLVVRLNKRRGVMTYPSISDIHVSILNGAWDQAHSHFLGGDLMANAASRFSDEFPKKWISCLHGSLDVLYNCIVLKKLIHLPRTGTPFAKITPSIPEVLSDDGCQLAYRQASARMESERGGASRRPGRVHSHFSGSRRSGVIRSLAVSGRIHFQG